MFETLLIFGALPWLLIGVHQISSRSFAILLLWLLIAPILTFYLNRGDETVLFEESSTRWTSASEKYNKAPATITLKKLIKPTRIVLALLLVCFLLNVIVKKVPWVPFDRTESWMSIFSLILLISILFRSSRVAFPLHTAVDSFILPFSAHFITKRFVTNEDRFQKLTRVVGYLGVYLIVFCLVERFQRRICFTACEVCSRREILYTLLW